MTRFYEAARKREGKHKMSASAMPMTRSQLLRDVGEALYGLRWQSELARDLGMSARHMRRLASGAAELTLGMRTDLLRIAEERAQAIDAAIDSLRRAIAPCPLTPDPNQCQVT